LVIPVYNGARTIAEVVRRVHAKYDKFELEVILGRLFLDHSQTPQFVVRYVLRPGTAPNERGLFAVNDSAPASDA
jgi:hypothetical protein